MIYSKGFFSLKEKIDHVKVPCDLNSLYDILYALQSGRCRGAETEPVGQNKVL